MDKIYQFFRFIFAIKEFSPDFDVIEENRSSYVVRAQSLVFENAGNTVVLINGLYEIQPCGFFAIPLTKWNYVIKANFQINFGATNVVDKKPVTKRLQIITLTNHDDKILENYVSSR